MKRLKDDFIEIIAKRVPLKTKKILELGCGAGLRSQLIAERCKELVAIDPDKQTITTAKKNNHLKNLHYYVGSAEKLSFTDNSFDIVLFTLSLHHIPKNKMNKAIDEAVRVVKKDGKIIVFEPFFTGSFFEAEIQFDASDGDERKEKAYAYFSMLNHKKLKEINEIYDETIMKFESYNDMIASMNPKKDIKKLRTFLAKNDYILSATRRINIFKVIK